MIAASALSIGTRLAPPLTFATIFGGTTVELALEVDAERELFFATATVDALRSSSVLGRLVLFSFSNVAVVVPRCLLDPFRRSSARALPLSFTGDLRSALLRCFVCFSCKGGCPPASSSSSETPSSAAKLLIAPNVIASPGVGEMSGLSFSSLRELSDGIRFSGLSGEFASIRMRLSGLGLTGEYACIMRAANGFAIGKGRREGVLAIAGSA